MKNFIIEVSINIPYNLINADVFINNVDSVELSEESDNVLIINSHITIKLNDDVVSIKENKEL